MPACKVKGCRSRSGIDNVKMNSFPKESERRTVWIKNIGLKQDPSKYAVVCEEHFTSDMWEKVRQDGSRKLKCNAVPTIFREESESHHTIQKLPAMIGSSANQELNLESPRKRIDDEIQEIDSAPPLDVKNNLKVPPSSSSTDIDDDKMVNTTLQESWEERFLKLEKLYLRSERLRKQMQVRHKKKYQQWRAVVTKLRKKCDILEANVPKEIKKIFNEDQLEVLSTQKKPLKWSNTTLTKGYQLKFSCGNTGYKEVMKHIPLPSVRALCRNLGSWDFKSGMLDKIFDFLKIKVQNFEKSIYNDCVLTLDECCITKGKVFDISTNSYVGYVTLTDGNSQIEYADNILVFMLAGIAARWKQPVAYYYTTKSTEGRLYKPVIIDIIKKSEDIGLFIQAVISDMGSNNQAMWSSFGISASRDHINNKCINPVNKNRYLYFFQDGPHAFKNFKEGFLNNKIIKISDTCVKKYNLPSTEANSKHFEELLDFQNEFEFKLAPKFKEEYIYGNKHFRKMRVENTSNVLNHAVGSSLQWLANENNKPEYETTAWIVNTFHKWWQITSCRQINLALSSTNPQAFKETKDFLLDFIEIIKTLKVGINPKWKPYQTGLLITTKSTLELSEYLLNEKGYKFVFGARFTQDCLENLFSSLRAKNVVLNALQAKNNLKILCVSSYMKNPSTGSYNTDDRQMLSGFLDFINNKSNNKKPQAHIMNKIPHLPIINVSLSKVELNLLHHIAGYLIRSIIITTKICKKCITLTGGFKASASYSQLTNLRCYKNNTLFFVNNITFNFFLKMENIFRTYFDDVHAIKDLDLKAFFVQKFSVLPYNVPNCHKLKLKIMRRFASYRLKIKSDKLKKISNNLLSSKSMYMHYSVN